MVKYNKVTQTPVVTKAVTTPSTKKSPKVKNLAGAVAYQASDKLALASVMLTSMVSDTFYRTEAETVKHLKHLVSRVDPLFAAQTAVYARRRFGLRSITHLTAAELVSTVSGTAWGSDFYRAIADRPDDMTEIVSLLEGEGKGRAHVSNAMRKGFGRRLAELDEYTLAKYARRSGKVKLVDLVNVCHPKATPALTALVNGSLASPDTWEVAISAAKGPEEKAAEWERLVVEDRLGYLALLRNIRNVALHAPQALETALERLADESFIRKGRVFPHQILVAYKTLEKAELPRSVLDQALSGLDRAATVATSNIPAFAGKTLVAVDSSGSMSSAHSNSFGGLSPSEVGGLLGLALAYGQDTDLMTFDTKAVKVKVNKDLSLMKSFSKIKSMGGGTSFHCIFQGLNTRYDRIIVLSDMQGWETGDYTSPRPMKTSFAEYKARTDNPDVALWSIDLLGYGTLMFPEHKVFTLAGYSDKLFDVMTTAEREGGLDTLVKAIEDTEF